MPEGLPLIIVDDEVLLCKVIAGFVEPFYVWGDVHVFSDPEEAVSFCLSRETGVAVFILDVFLGARTGFDFLEAIRPKFPLAPQDTIIMTGNASDEVVNMCIASDITYLLEKPIRQYALQLAVRAIVSKYVKFARILLLDPVLAHQVTILNGMHMPN
jgi:CheY-like chemotaxis protein